MLQREINFDAVKDILLIEDDLMYAELVSILLAESELIDCAITHSTTLQGALQLLSEGKKYAAILLDLSLPDSFGFDTLARLKKAAPYENVIVLTGGNDSEMGVQAVKAGAQDYLEKGQFKEEELAKTLLYAIERNAILTRLGDTQRVARIGNWECCPDQHYFFASEEVYRIFDLSPNNIFSCEDLMQESCPFHFFLKIQQRVLEKDILEATEIISTHKGHTVHVAIRCKSGKLPDGKLTYSGIIQDVTAITQAHNERVKSEARYRQIFYHSKEAIFNTTTKGKLRFFNPATEHFFGLTPPELSDLDCIFELFLPFEKWQKLEKLLLMGKAISDAEIQIAAQNGNVRTCLIAATVSEHEGQENYNFIIHDITQRKQAEALQVAKELAEERAKVREQLIASVSHELRTPMNAILGMLNFLDGPNLNESQREYLQAIRQSSDLLLGLVNDILLAASLKHQTLQLEKKPFKLSELLRGLMQMMHQQLNGKPIQLQLEVGQEVPDLMVGDQLRLNQILYNLVGNAIKFTDQGHVSLRVSVDGISPHQVVVGFEVKDSGIGIPKEKIEQIFQPFSRVRHKDRLFGGTGLGLSIVKQLVELQEGTVDAKSIENQGSTFYVSIPFLLEAEGSEAPQHVKTAPMQPDYTAIQILVAEDHEMNQLVVKRILAEYWPNARLDLVPDGLSALQLAQQKKFDIVLMDIQMPKMNGIEVTKKIREDGPNKTVPVIGMTAHLQIDEDENFYHSAGFNDILFKPYSPTQFLSIMNQQLENKMNHV